MSFNRYMSILIVDHEISGQVNASHFSPSKQNSLIGEVDNKIRGQDILRYKQNQTNN